MAQTLAPRTGAAPALPNDLAAELRARVQGEVRFDDTSRLLYSTDASIYQIVPVGVVIPRDPQDVAETIRIAAARGVPVLPRGSGTSLAGQSVNTAVVLDFTKYQNQVLELNAEERWVRVQPGVILDELNAWLQPHGLHFPPDVATSNRASIGGMMGNNSSGAHSILYGKTVDHVLEQRVVLADGSEAHFRELPPEEWERRGQGSGSEARIYREISRICAENAEEVERRFPRIMRRVGGYNLDEIVRRQRLNLAAIAVGSEGTLVAVTEAKLNLVPRPKHTALLVSHFAELIAALEATPLIVSHAPSAVELTDRMILDLSRHNRDLAPARAFLQGDPAAILATEFYADSPEELAGKVETLRQALERERRGYAHVVMLDPPEQKKVWEVRKAGLGLLMGMKGDSKPIGFVEDTAVPPECLADYIREFRQLLGQYGLQACFYAHASVGCLHVRPVLNLKETADVQRMREVASGVADLVLKYGGAMSAEHGDGLVRSEWQERMFGAQLYQAFRQVKAAFDPQGIMNPGKIVEAPPMDRNLRIGPDFTTLPVSTTLDFSRDGGFARAVELCSGVGACRKKTDGTMCPSYRATLDEAHSTRGRATMLRMAISGQLPALAPGADGHASANSSAAPFPVLPTAERSENGQSPSALSPQPSARNTEHPTPNTHNPQPSTITPTLPHSHTPTLPHSHTLADPRVLEVLDLCLECKACKSECPSNVDMAKLKYEFLAHYYERHGVPARARFFGAVADAAAVAVRFAPLANWLLRQSWFQRILEGSFGISSKRRLPPYAAQSFVQWWSGWPGAAAGGERGEVLFLADTFTNYNEPEIGKAAVRLLQAFGYRVTVPPLRCCGRPMISKGLLAKARRNAEWNLSLLGGYAARGVPLVGVEPSCVVTYRDEYQDFGLGEAAEKVAAQTWMLEDFLAERHSDEGALRFRETPREVLLHGHCQQKAVLGLARAVRALRMVPGFQVTALKTGCCGMAGTFGYEREHYEISLRIGELGLLPQVRAASPDALIVAAGTSCRHQVHDATGRTAVHPAVALASALREEAVV